MNTVTARMLSGHGELRTLDSWDVTESYRDAVYAVATGLLPNSIIRLLEFLGSTIVLYELKIRDGASKVYFRDITQGRSFTDSMAQFVRSVVDLRTEFRDLEEWQWLFLKLANPGKSGEVALAKMAAIMQQRQIALWARFAAEHGGDHIMPDGHDRHNERTVLHDPALAPTYLRMMEEDPDIDVLELQIQEAGRPKVLPIYWLPEMRVLGDSILAYQQDRQGR